MCAVKISAKSIGEINLIYKKIKKDFKALDGIKLNQKTTEYELFLEKNELDAALKLICDKVLDANELMDEKSVFENFSWVSFIQKMDLESVPMPFRSLKPVWKDLTSEKQKACFHYLCEETGIGTDSNDLVVL